MTDICKKHVVYQECMFPKGFCDLYSLANIENEAEAFTLLLHAFMLETGFLPKDIIECNKYQCMPEGWKSKDVFKIQYYHKYCPAVFGWMTAIPLYSTLIVHGNLDSEECEDVVNIKLQIDSYICCKDGFSDPSKVFKDIQELSRIFKDGFCFPLLALLQDSSKSRPFFGLCGLVGELKMYLLKFLPVEDIVSLSAVNKDFNNMINTPQFWEYLVRRDFFPAYPSDIDATLENNKWKTAYEVEYVKRRTPRPPFFHPYRYPMILPVDPDYDADLSIAFNPYFQQTFPHLQSRFQESNLYLQFLGGYPPFYRRYY